MEKKKYEPSPVIYELNYTYKRVNNKKNKKEIIFTNKLLYGKNYTLLNFKFKEFYVN